MLDVASRGSDSANLRSPNLKAGLHDCPMTFEGSKLWGLGLPESIKERFRLVWAEVLNPKP